MYNENTLIFDPEDPSISKFGAMSKGKRAKHCIYEFDKVFGQNASQQEIYEYSTAPLINHTIDGYNSSVFAYGATGAGKTHTMIGNTIAGPGVMIQALKDLYKKIDEIEMDEFVKVSVSYLEVYNEQIRDLLVTKNTDDIGDFTERNLELCEEGGKVNVRGLCWHNPSGLSELLDLLEKGNTYRARSPTDANALSSRSHAVLQIHVESKSKLEKNIENPWKIGKLSLIDLAGSERASVTRNSGDRMKEGANINRSLLALGNCINALCQQSGKKNIVNHIPYRDSKLTRLLKDSLGGSCKTVMIANISPSSLSFDDTYNTLKYANRAKNIKSTLTKNVSLPSAPQDQQEIALLRQQLANTKQQLLELQKESNSKNNILLCEDSSVSNEKFKLASDKFECYKREIKDLFSLIMKEKTQLQMLNKNERKCIGQLQKYNSNSNSSTINIESIENEIEEIHEQQKSIISIIDKANVDVRNMYQEIEQSLSLIEFHKLFLLQDIQYNRVCIEKQDLIEICSSKDCKLQLQQLKIQELENILSSSNHSKKSISATPSTLLSKKNDSLKKNIPSNILRQSLSSSRPKKRSLRDARQSNIRNITTTTTSTSNPRVIPQKKKSSKSITSSSTSNPRPRFTFSSPPQSILKKTNTKTTNTEKEQSNNDINENQNSKPKVPQTPLSALGSLNLGKIASPPRRVRKRKQNSQPKIARKKIQSSSNVSSLKNESNPTPTPKLNIHPSSVNTQQSGVLSISQQLAALKEKRARESAVFASRSNINQNTPLQIQVKESKPILQENNVLRTPLPKLTTGKLRKPSASLTPNLHVQKENVQQ